MYSVLKCCVCSGSAACTFASNNAGRSDTEVDLHGLSVAEAQAKVEQVISSARSQAQGRRQPEPITFIVGQGRHSQLHLTIAATPNNSA
ncbi:uncharacterized protein HaLaN_25733 [Haematococcus lacustris]|uniref:Smr domain-containing protein n=1 Tax=Haematococcus lacustris TaxID=44745 RepID=A0A699ZZ31_HAELA|nr:uncharacterized protein HaLaN_25733 [Haematococcus lacustris]